MGFPGCHIRVRPVGGWDDAAAAARVVEDAFRRYGPSSWPSSSSGEDDPAIRRQEARSTGSWHTSS